MQGKTFSQIALILVSSMLLLCSNCRGVPVEPQSGALGESSPAEQGLDPERMKEVSKTGAEMEDLTSLLVLRHGRLVLEQYAGGADRSTAFNVKSVCKSFVSALVGVAIQEGRLSGVEQKVADFFPQYSDSFGPDKKEFTLRHLLTHTSGLQWIENGPVVQEWVSSPDWVRFIFALPQAQKPGAAFNYSTAGTHLLSAILTRATGNNALAYGTDHLFREAGINIARWDSDPQGNSFGGAELYLTARDMARFGLLYLNEGNIEGRQLIPAQWVRESTRIQADIGGDPQIEGYGYQWWVRRDIGKELYYAAGAGGQFIFIVPSRDMVVVATSSLFNSQDASRVQKHYFATLRLLVNQIIPAVVD